MLKTIHVEIVPTGHIHVLEPIPFKLEGRALLTFFERYVINRPKLVFAQFFGDAGQVAACHG